MTGSDRIFVNLDDNEDGCCPVESDTSDHGKFFDPQSATEYIRADLHTAALSAEYARGREQGLREAADSLLECSVWCDSQERTDDGWRNGLTDARRYHMARILALIRS